MDLTIEQRITIPFAAMAPPRPPAQSTWTILVDINFMNSKTNFQMSENNILLSRKNQSKFDRH